MNQIPSHSCLFILSGEHDTLPQAELMAILEAEGFPFTLLWRRERTVLLKVSPSGAKRVVQRAGLVNHASTVVMESSTDESSILRALDAIDYSQWLPSKARFGVKVTRVQRESVSIDVDALQSKIGSVIWQSLKGRVQVDLAKPDSLFLGVIVGDQFFFGLHLKSRERSGLYQRRSPLRPFFVPSAIHPKSARVMVNLSRAAPCKLFLDPFCGTGGLLLEAADIGCVPISVDINPTILAGCRENLNHFKVAFNGVLGDARTPPIRPGIVNAIATDPPYGRSSSTKGAKVGALIQSSLGSLADLLDSKSYLCIALPFEHFNEEIIPSDSFHVKETHTMRIHRSLKRQIVVLQRK
jgi:tRNA (guanine10-N2)-dimethyltransferase